MYRLNSYMHKLCIFLHHNDLVQNQKEKRRLFKTITKTSFGFFVINPHFCAKFKNDKKRKTRKKYLCLDSLHETNTIMEQHCITKFVQKKHTLLFKSRHFLISDKTLFLRKQILCWFGRKKKRIIFCNLLFVYKSKS